MEYPVAFPPLKVSRFSFYPYRFKVIGEGIYFVVYFDTHSQVSTCVSPINTGISLSFGVSDGMLLTDLSKAFDCLRNDLMIAKLAADGFDQPSLCLIFSYL